MDINNIVKGSSTGAFLPQVAGNHATGDKTALMAEQIRQQVKFLGSQIKPDSISRGLTVDKIEIQAGKLETKNLLTAAPPQQYPNVGQQFTGGKGFDHVVIGPAV